VAVTIEESADLAADEVATARLLGYCWPAELDTNISADHADYHKLDVKRLETLIHTYLSDWISRQKQDIASGVDGAEERLAAAEALKKKLELILEGELEKQPIGWNPDLNDGVRLNIRPFVLVGDVGLRDAGVLRDPVTDRDSKTKALKFWKKDCGKDVESAPWYHVFDGECINDHHLALAEKRAAREKGKQV